MKREILATCLTLAAPSAWADPQTPARGTELRQLLLDTVRSVAVQDLGAPVEFVVIQLEADGDRAFARLNAQRPGGAPIDIAQTPLVLRDGIAVDFIDGAQVEAFLEKIGTTWVIDEYAVGATDVWWIGGPYCTHYASMLPAQACP